tara:strand:- start:146 stop:346 length:201 start_codon:yes stop_codon:yes gene_type:complete
MKKKKSKKRNMKTEMKTPQPHDPLKVVKAFSRELTKLMSTSTKVHKDKKKYSRKQKHKKNLSHEED